MLPGYLQGPPVAMSKARLCGSCVWKRVVCWTDCLSDLIYCDASGIRLAVQPLGWVILAERLVHPMLRHRSFPGSSLGSLTEGLTTR